SEKRLARPMPRTPRVIQDLAAGADLAAGFTQGLRQSGARGGGEKRRGGGEDALAPDAAAGAVEPKHVLAEIAEGSFGEHLLEEVVDALLKLAVFGAEAVGRDVFGEQGHADEQVVGVHPPGEPGLELGLAA